MKFCPKCGTQLVDEARFCSKCGAAQPNMENVPAPQPATAVQQTPAPQPAPVQEPSQMTPGQRYNYLKQNDERFKETTKVVSFLKFVGLINLLFIIPWLVCFLVPVGTLTGIDVSDFGYNLMSASGKSFPYNFSMFEVQFTLRQWANAGNYKLTPDNSLGSNIMPSILWYFGFLFLPLLAVIAIVGNPRGYILRTYEKNPQELYKVLKNNTVWIFGPALALIAMVNAIVTYASCTDLDYSDDKHYFLGIITGNKGGLTAVIVVSAIFIVAMIAGSIVLRTLLFKKINKYYK